MKAIILLAVLCFVLSVQTRAECLEADLAEMRRMLQYNSWASTPPELRELFKNSRLDESYEPVYDDVNPFYLCADFDGDKKRDYAVLVRSKGEKGKHISQIAII